MRNLYASFYFLAAPIPRLLSAGNSFKLSHLKGLMMSVLFCCGGNAEWNVADKNNSASERETIFASTSGKNLLMQAATSPTDYFRSRQSGNWSTPATWESSPDNITWQTATGFPTKDANTIIIRGTHIVSVSSSVSLDQTIINGTLELLTGGVLNINDGAGDDITISANGVLQIASNSSYATAIKQNGDADIHIATNGKILIGNGGSVGAGYENFVTSLINIWDDKSVYEYNSSATFLIIDPIIGLTYFPNAGMNIPIFRVTKVGGTVTNPVNKDFYLNGLLELNTDVSFTGVGKKYFRNGIRGNATLSQTGTTTGKFYLTAPNAVLEGTSLKIVLVQPLDLSLNSIIPNGANVTVSGANINNNFASNVFTIDGTLDVTDKGITNTNGTVIINGTFRTANTGGFSGGGSSIVSGSISVNTGSTIELYALGNQSLNSRGDFKNLIFSGSGIKTPNGPFNPNGTITIKDAAIFDCIMGRNIGDDNTNLTMIGNSRLIVTSVGTNPKMGGVYNLTGGVVEFRGSNLTAQTIRNQTYQNIEISGNNVNNSDGNIILNNAGTFIVKDKGVFSINDNTIAGPIGNQTIIVESGGTFKCGNTKGFHGFAFTTVPKFNSSINADIENIILQSNSTVEYSRSQPPLSSGDQPITHAGNLIYQNLVLSGTGNKTAPPGDLIIQGNLSKTGTATFVHNNGTVIFNGNNSQVYTSASPQMVFNNFTNKNIAGLHINDNLSVYKEFLLGNNSKINLNADITLLSSKNNTANVAQIPANAVINYNEGRFIVERFISTGDHQKSWQFIAAPAFGSTVHDTWQEKGNNAISGYGTWITDPSGTNNGFDAVSFTPSMKYYDPVNNDWVGISNTHINLEDEKGYMLFVRGDRLANNLNSPATPTILRTRGKLFSPAAGFTPPLIAVAPGKFQSIGNPYASAIDFTKVNRSNIENSYTAWDPTLYGNYGLGGYQTISGTTFFKAVPGATSFYDNSMKYNNIQSGHAFFVHNYSDDMTGSVSFDEANKSADNHLVHRNPLPEVNERQFLFTNLYTIAGNIADGNAVAFDNQFSNKIDSDDALKINNSGECFGIKRGGKILSVEARKSLMAIDTIFFEMKNLAKQEYKLVFIPENIGQNANAFLIDQYLNTEKPVSLSDSTFINFSVSSYAASSAANRFMIVFRTSAAALSVSFISVNANKQNANVLVEWKVENENNMQQYEVEYSKNGIHFSAIAKIAATNILKSTYKYVDNNPVEGYNYYRIRSLEKDGKISYSQTVKVFIENLKSSIGVYPNPLAGENISLQFTHQPAGCYHVRLLNSLGEIMLSKEINYAGGSNTQNILLNKSAVQGVYHLEIIKPDGEKIVLKVIR